MALKNSTLHTPLTTNLQKELEGHENIPKRVSDVCTYLDSLLKVAFGLKGRAIMVQKQNGQMMITRSGSQILNHVITDVEQCDPIYKILISCSRNIEIELGDGVKRFILFTNVICKLLSSNLKYDVFREKLNQLVCIQNALKLAESEYAGRTDVLDLNLLRKITKSFVSTRFSAAVSNIFSHIIGEWFSCYNASGAIEDNTIKFMHTNFNVLCKRDEKPSSISESSVCEGVLLKGEIISPFPLQTKEIKSILIVYYLPETEKRTRKNTEYDVMSILNEELVKTRTLPLLLVTNVILSDTLKCFVRMKKISSLQCVSEEEVLFLHNYSLSYFKSGDCIINFSLHSSDKILKLSLANISQLVICSPTTDIGLQLHSSLYNLVTLLKYLLSNNLLVFGSNSLLLNRLYLSLSSKGDHCSNLQPILHSKAILNDWHDSESSKNSLVKPSLDEKSPRHQFVSHIIETTLGYKYINNDSILLLGNIIFPLINSYTCYVSENFLDVIPLEIAVLNRSLSAAIKLLSIDRILDSKRLSGYD